MKKYIKKVLFIEIDEKEFLDLVENFLPKYNNITFKELCDGGEYIELEPIDVSIPYIGSIDNVDADIIQIWHKFERNW